MTEQRLPIVNADDGVWGDILRQYLMKEHYDDGTDNAVNGGHKTVTIRPGTASAGTAPLKFTTGTLLTTPEAGAMEFAGDNYYLTDTSGPTRRKIAAYDDTSGATGDIYYRNSSGYFTRLGIGSAGDLLTVSGGIPSWSSSISNASTITLKDTNFTLQDNSDTSKQLKFELSNISASTTRTLTLPDANTTLVGINTTDTLTNKTLTSPKVNQILDTNGATSLNLVATASAVNYFSVYNSNAGAGLSLVAAGSDTNISMYLQAKGTGSIFFNTMSGPTIFTASPVPSAVNYLQLQNAATGASPGFNATGSDTNVSLNLTTKGTGVVQANGVDVVTTTGTQTLTNKTLTDPKINAIKDTTNNLTSLAFASPASAVNYITVNSSATGLGVNLSATGSDGSINLDLNPKGSGQVRITGVPVVTTTGTQTFTNKTISGSTNTITDLPASAIPNAARLVGNTALGGAGVEDGAATWTKIATFTMGSTYQSASVLLSIISGPSSNEQAIVSVNCRSQGIGQDNSVDVQILSKARTAAFITTASFKVITGSYGTSAELWMFKNAASGQFSIYELAKYITHSSGSVTYYTSSPWQSATPSNTVEATSSGVTAFGLPVATTTGTETLTNKTLTTPRISQILDNTNGTVALTLNADASAVNYFQVSGKPTGNPVYVSARGADTDISLYVQGKGTGKVILTNDAGAGFSVTAATSSVNRVEVSGSATGNAPSLAAIGSDTNIGINLVPKGSGTVQANNVEVATISGTQTLTNKTLTAPRVNYITDTSGGSILQFVPIASATKLLQIVNNTAGNPVILQVAGSGSASGLVLAGQTTYVRIQEDTQTGRRIADFQSNTTAGSYNYLEFRNADSGAAPYVKAVATADSNVNLNLVTTGTGTVQANSVDVVTVSGTQTLTNKTISGSSNTLSNIPLSALSASTSTAIGVGSIELGHASDTTLSRSSAGVLAVEGVVVPTVSSTNTLTNKTISGTANTLTNITGASFKAIADTALGSTGTEDGANTWAKLATFTNGTNNWAHSSSFLIVGDQFTAAVSALLYVRFSNNGGASSASAEVLNITDTAPLSPENFRITYGVLGDPYELWVKKNSQWGRFLVYWQGSAGGGWTFSWSSAAAWQSATPTGSVGQVDSTLVKTPVSAITASTSTALGVGSLELGHVSDTTLSRSSAGVLAVEGVPVVTTTGTQTLTNKTIDTTNTVSVKDTLFTLQDDGDTTKRAKFELSGITTSTTRTLTVPNASGTIALTSDITASGGMLAPVQGMTLGSETFTISSGSVTQISGTTINGYTPAIGDRILVANAPATTGTGSSYSMTSQPTNGIYVVTGNTTNLTVSRATDMSGSVKPGGLSVYVQNATWPGSKTIFFVEYPSDASAFTWGTTSLSWKWTGGLSGQQQQIWINDNSLGFNVWNGTGWTYFGATTNSGNQDLTLPATATDTIVARTSTDTLTNKRITPRVGTTASSATPSINTDDYDVFTITALAADITSMTTNLTGTPVNEQKLMIRIKDDGSARTITWGASFVSSGAATLLATTVASKTHRVGLVYDSTAAKWVCIAVDEAGY